MVVIKIEARGCSQYQQTTLEFEFMHTNSISSDAVYSAGKLLYGTN
jgi:hypothetical protein